MWSFPWAGALVYTMAEAYSYAWYTLRRRHFGTPFLGNAAVALARAARVFERFEEINPNYPERVVNFPLVDHLVNRDEVIRNLAGLCVPGIVLFGSFPLECYYQPLCFQLLRRFLYLLGTVAMRHYGYEVEVFDTAGGEYSVWTRTVRGTKPIVAFPGFGLGAVPYHRVLASFHRTVHIVEMPNHGYSRHTIRARVDTDDIYRVVRQCVGDRPHDILAHSLGSSPAALYVNRQHYLHTTPAGQTAVIFDGLVHLLDATSNVSFAFSSLDSFSRISRARTNPPWYPEFLFFHTVVLPDLEVQLYMKRFNTSEGLLWRKDYRTRVRYVFCEDDILFDVPYIREAVRRVEGGEYLFLCGRHGNSMFFGDSATGLERARRWMANP